MGGTGSEAQGASLTSSSTPGSAGMVVHNTFNITTPDANSFLRSRGEIARAFQNSIRGTQRS
jgi:hypothetical protein